MTLQNARTVYNANQPACHKVTEELAFMTDSRTKFIVPQGPKLQDYRVTSLNVMKEFLIVYNICVRMSELK